MDFLLFCNPMITNETIVDELGQQQILHKPLLIMHLLNTDHSSLHVLIYIFRVRRPMLHPAELLPHKIPSEKIIK